MKGFDCCILKKQQFFIPFLFSWALLSNCSLSAQIKLSDFENTTRYTVDQGLPSSGVNAIAEDTMGFLWIATDDGVSRFDGNNFMNFEHYYHENALHRLYSIHALFVDEVNDRLWIGSDKGLFYTSMDTLRFRKYDKEGVLFKEYGNNVQCLHKTGDDRLWAGGAGGLLSFDLNDLSQLPIVHNITYLDEPFAGVRCISSDPVEENVIWFGTTKGLIRFNTISVDYQIFRYGNNPELDENMIRKIHVTQDKVLLGTWAAGLVIFDKDKETYQKPLGQQFPNSHKLINDFYCDQNNLWVTTLNGIIHYDCSNESIIDLKAHDFKNEKIRGVSFVDSRGIIWFGNSLGLFKYSQERSGFRFIQLENRSSVDVPMNPRRIISSNGVYYLAGYASSGIYKIDPKDYSIQIIKIPQFRRYEHGVNIMDMAVMPNNDLLITSDKQLLTLDLKTHEISLAPLQIPHPNPAIQALVKDKNDNYWVGSRLAGLYKLDFSKDSVTCFNDALNEYDDDNYVWINRLFIDSQNKLWIAKGSHTVIDINGEVVHNLNLADSLPFHKDVFGFEEDSKGRVWMAGGRNGLSYTNFKNFENGIVHILDGNFYGVYARNDSILWTISNGQLGQLNTNILKYTVVPTSKTNRHIKPTGPIVHNGDGEFIMGCENGLLIYNPGIAKKNLRPSLPYVKEIIANGKTVFDGKNLTARTFSFNSETTHISVKISALCFNPIKSTSYKYKIKDDWIDVGLGNDINFTNLPPGDYSFELMADNTQEDQEETIVSYHFSILPPLWKTWWAYIIYIGLFTGLAWWSYRFQLTRKLAVSEGRRLKEINQLKSSLYTNITHEFRTPLTVILGMTDVLRANGEARDKKAEDGDKSLEMIERNGNRLLHLVNQMLDLAKLESGNMELQQITADVVPFVKYLCESFQYLAEGSNISLVVYSEIDELVMDFDTTKLSAIISNLLSNAIKFTPTGGKIVVHLKQTKTKTKACFFIKVKDTGIGISEDTLPHIFNRFYQVNHKSSEYGGGTGIGLAITKELIGLMGGTINVKSVLNKGSEFVVEIPVVQTASDVMEAPMPLMPESQASIGRKPPARLSVDVGGELPLALIIEDSADVAHYLATCLKGRYKTLHAQNGNIGLDMAYNYIPDVVICDVLMPEKDGYEVCNTLKSDVRTDHIPVIMLTAKASTQDRLSGLAHGADAYLAKPFNIAELHIRIDQLVQLRKNMIGKIAGDDFGAFLKHKVEDPEARFLQKAIKSIHTEMSNDLFGPKGLARNLHLSESQLYRKLKAISGKSTAVFIRSVRLQRARELLQTTDKTISEISYEIGFNDPSWFSRSFKEEFGFTPSAMHK